MNIDMDLFSTAVDAVTSFAILYPVAVSWMGIVGAWLFHAKWESHNQAAPALSSYPRVSFLVCCGGSPAAVERTIAQLHAQRYPEVEILAINNGASASMGPMLDRLVARFPRLRVVHVNEGLERAVLLRTGAMLAQGEFLVCVEPGALVDPDAIAYMMGHFLAAGRVGAVVGQTVAVQPRRFLEQVALAEYALRAYMLPRAARIYGKLLEVPDGLVAYRKSALHQLGYWSPDIRAPELHMLWSLQAACWGVRFEPRAQYWRDVPRGVGAWLRARTNWWQGLRDAARIHRPALRSWRNRRLWLPYAGMMLTRFWALCVGAVFLYALLGPWLVPEAALDPSWLFSAAFAVLVTSAAYAVLESYLSGSLGTDDRSPVLAVFLAPWVYWLFSLVGPWAWRGAMQAHSQQWRQPSASAR